MNVYKSILTVKNEDIHVEDSFEHLKLIAVAEGHGGVGAADICRQNLEPLIKKHLKSTQTLEICLHSTFRELHELCKTLPCCSGCTPTLRRQSGASKRVSTEQSSLGVVNAHHESSGPRARSRLVGGRAAAAWGSQVRGRSGAAGPHRRGRCRGCAVLHAR